MDLGSCPSPVCLETGYGTRDFLWEFQFGKEDFIKTVFIEFEKVELIQMKKQRELSFQGEAAGGGCGLLSCYGYFQRFLNQEKKPNKQTTATTTDDRPPGGRDAEQAGLLVCSS